MTTDLDPKQGNVERIGRDAFGWRRLLVLSAFGTVASLLVPMLITLSLEPFLLSMAAPVVIGLLVMRRWPRAGSITLGVVSLALLASGAPFLVDALSHPESLVDFLPLALFTASALLGTIAAIPAYRETTPPKVASGPARGLALAGAVILAAAAVVSVVSFAGVDSQEASPGDVRLVAEEIEWAPGDLAAGAGTISVHVTNRDATRHTFTIDALDVDLNVPPNTTQRVTFEASPGNYPFYCSPHADAMEGTLTVG